MRGLFSLVLFALASSIAVAAINAPENRGLDVSRSDFSAAGSSYRVAGDKQQLCAQLRANYDKCASSWKSLGGGNSGQAGSFQECMNVYRNAMIAAGC